MWKSLKCIVPKGAVNDAFSKECTKLTELASFYSFMNWFLHHSRAAAVDCDWLQFISRSCSSSTPRQVHTSAPYDCRLQIYALIPWLTHWLFERSNIRTVVFHTSCSKLWECLMMIVIRLKSVFISFGWMWDEWAWWCGIFNLFILGHTLNLIHIWIGMCVKTNSSCKLVLFPLVGHVRVS